jgi:hypothetical protein
MHALNERFDNHGVQVYKVERETIEITAFSFGGRLQRFYILSQHE